MKKKYDTPKQFTWVTYSDCTLHIWEWLSIVKRIFVSCSLFLFLCLCNSNWFLNRIQSSKSKQLALYAKSKQICLRKKYITPKQKCNCCWCCACVNMTRCSGICVVGIFFLLFHSLGKLVFWWKFNCCFESRRQPLAEKLFTKAPSKEMLCQSCFSPPKNLFPRKVLHKKKHKNNLETGVFFFWRIWCSKWGNEKLSGAYLTLQKIESHFPWNFPRATPRDEGTSKASPNSHRQVDDEVWVYKR